MSPRTRGLGVNHEQRREEIADAVLAIVADRGLAAVSLAAVAEQAGISPGRVQHYFATKRALTEAAFERGNALSGARIREKAGSELDAAPARTVLTIVLTELIPYDAETWAHMRVRQSFGALALVEEPIAARMRDAYGRFHEQMAELLRREQEDGRIPEDREPEQDAVALVALAEGLAYYVLIGATPAEDARDRVLAAIEDVYAAPVPESGHA